MKDKNKIIVYCRELAQVDYSCASSLKVYNESYTIHYYFHYDFLQGSFMVSL